MSTAVSGSNPYQYRALPSRAETAPKRRVAQHFCPQSRNELGRTDRQQSHGPASLCSESIRLTGTAWKHTLKGGNFSVVIPTTGSFHSVANERSTHVYPRS